VDTMLYTQALDARLALFRNTPVKTSNKNSY